MKHLRWLLLPFALIYGAIVALRNALYTLGVKKSYSIPQKAIVVGNLSVGGTGKTPLVAYLVQHFIDSNKKVATLSRGYGRSTKGVRFASANSNATEIGDEPLLYASRFGAKVNVLVAEKRKEGILQLIDKHPETEIIVLDDAFQHRAVKAGLNILVTEFDRPFSSDWMLPVGRLREQRSGARRADIIVVSKCPDKPDPAAKESLRKQLARFNQPVFFTSLRYGELVPMNTASVNAIKNVLLVTGIGNPTPLVNYLETQFSVTHIKFPDHHDFSSKDIGEIRQKFNTFASHDKIIVATEKDFMRLRAFEEVISGEIPWFYQPIEVIIENETHFTNLLDNYVREI